MLNLLPALILLVLQGALGVDAAVALGADGSMRDRHSVRLALSDSDAQVLRKALQQWGARGNRQTVASSDSRLMLRIALLSVLAAAPVPDPATSDYEREEPRRILRPPDMQGPPPHPGFGEGARTRDGPTTA